MVCVLYTALRHFKKKWISISYGQQFYPCDLNWELTGRRISPT